MVVDGCGWLWGGGGEGVVDGFGWFFGWSWIAAGGCRWLRTVVGGFLGGCGWLRVVVGSCIL